MTSARTRGLQGGSRCHPVVAAIGVLMLAVASCRSSKGTVTGTGGAAGATSGSGGSAGATGGSGGGGPGGTGGASGHGGSTGGSGGSKSGSGGNASGGGGKAGGDGQGGIAGAIGCGATGGACGGAAGSTSPDGGTTDAGDGSVADGSQPASLTWSAALSDFGGDDVNSIWGTDSDVYVGTDFGHIYHLKNGAWTAASLGSSVCVGGGWGSGAQDVYAAGGCGWAALGSGTLFHSAGDDSWTAVPNTLAGFYAVWGSSASNVYAAGPAGLFHSRSGGAFADETVNGTPVSLWGSGPADVYTTEIGSSSNVLHSDGTGSWQDSLSGKSDDPWVVWGSGPTDVYAIFSPSFLSEATAFVMHRKGDSWTAESIDVTFTKLVALWGSGPGDVYIGGWHEDSSGSPAGGAFYHSAGDGNWTPVGIPAPIQQVRAIWGRSGTDVYVAAYDTFYGMVLWHGKP